jgi:DNA repair protein RecO (recombination protein O)
VREKDRVVEVFSKEEGRLRLLAAGIQRFPSRRAGHLEPLMESLIAVSSSARGDSIRDARVLQAFPAMREDLTRLRVAYYIAQLLREGTGERLSDAHLYDVSLALLAALDDPSRPVSPFILLSAELQMLQHLGSLPDLTRCGTCQRALRPGAFAFDSLALRFVCTGCAPGGSAASPHLTDAVKILRLLYSRPVPPARIRLPLAVLPVIAEIIRTLAQPLRVQIGVTLPPLRFAHHTAKGSW